MSGSPNLNGRVAVLGTGLIGGSIALAARAADESREVVGFDADAAATAAALRRGALTAEARTPAEAVAGAEMVVLALPVDEIPRALAELRGQVPDAAVVTDVGSAKGAVVRAGTQAFGDRFVGGHPMAGSEQHGLEAADAALFEDAWWILTPTAATALASYKRVAGFVASIGAKPVAVDPEIHDALVARLSHVPQLVASALVEVAATAGDREALLGLAGPGFRDVTRIAASNPELWVAILKENRSAVLPALAGLQDRLAELAGMLEQDRWDQVAAALGAARQARLELFAKPAYGGAPVLLEVPVPDRPGVLAEITTAAGELGANIEDLRIVHSTEGGRGRLELVVAGERSADLLAESLRSLGYRVERAELET